MSTEEDIHSKSYKEKCEVLLKECPKVKVPDTFLLQTAFPSEQLGMDCASSSAENLREESLKRHMDMCMSPLQIALASAVLQECIEMLNVLTSHCPNARSLFDFKDVNERFQSYQYPCKNTIIIQEEEDVSCRKKLAEDVGLLQKGLRIAKADLLYDDHIVLHCYLRNTLWQWRNDYNLQHWHQELSHTLSTMKYTSELLRSVAKKARKQSQMVLLHLQDVYEKNQFKYGTSVEYISSINASRVKQNTLFIKEQEDKQLELAASKADEGGNERKVHENIIKYYKYALTEIEGEILRWRQKYTKDMEEMEYKTYSLYTETSRQAAKLAEILALYCLREMQLDHYMERKEELFYLEASEYAMDELYTTIQSWWRGTLVRWELLQPDMDKKKKKQLKPKK